MIELLRQRTLLNLQRLLQTDSELKRYFYRAEEKEFQVSLVTFAPGYHTINCYNDRYIAVSIQVRNSQLLLCPAITPLPAESITPNLFQDAVGICSAINSVCGLGVAYVEFDFLSHPVIYLAIPLRWSQANKRGLRDIVISLTDQIPAINEAIYKHNEDIKNLKAILQEGEGLEDEEDFEEDN